MEFGGDRDNRRVRMVRSKGGLSDKFSKLYESDRKDKNKPGNKQQKKGGEKRKRESEKKDSNRNNSANKKRKMTDNKNKKKTKKTKKEFKDMSEAQKKKMVDKMDRDLEVYTGKKEVKTNPKFDGQPTFSFVSGNSDVFQGAAASASVSANSSGVSEIPEPKKL